MKRILGLDLGTNSIGWALVKQDIENKQGEILGMGSRIIPMDGYVSTSTGKESKDPLSDFIHGNGVSKNKARTDYRGVRRLRERHLLRRERMHRVLNILEFLPDHYVKQIDFEKCLGQFLEGSEPKLAYNNNEFIFKDSFNEMLEDFKTNQPKLWNRKNRKGKEAKIPYDWTIYYLRKKALTQKIKKEELAWIILNFNQKRGYYQLRGEEDEENPNKLVEFYSLKIADVVADTETNKKGETWYSMHLENGWIYRRPSKTDLSDWKNKVRDFIVTTDLNDDGSVKTGKEGEEKRNFRSPKEDDWTLVKKKTEQDIDNYITALETKQSKGTIGSYIYETLLQNPKQKIKGKLIRTIERKFYKDELIQILKTQQQFHPALKNGDIYNDCVHELYRNNEAHQLTLSRKDFVHLFIEDIIFYQRPLKSKKSSIGDCPLESRPMKDENRNLKRDKKGKIITKPLKAISKSNPLYQEFRLWQWIYNLSIYKREDDTNVTLEFLNDIEDYEELFDFLVNRKEVDQKALLKHFKLQEKTHRWNFVEDKIYPCNETKTQIASRLAKVENIKDNFLTDEIQHQLWHIIYSVTDKIAFEKGLKTFAKKHHLDEISFVEAFKKFPPFKSNYGSFSEKAIKKLLPLLRLGKHWKWDAIDGNTKDRIAKIINGEYDENIPERVRGKAIHLSQEIHFQGLQLWLASYIVYGRHSEANIAGEWHSVNDLKEYLKDFKQHSLRNPIVEQVVTETLRVVADIWQYYGNGAKDFFDEIHIELGREMKNTADDRKRITNQVTENENTNLRIKALLIEMMNDSHIENVRPYSPMQQEALKIYEDGVLNSNIAIPDDIAKISKAPQPTKTELTRYKLWLEQKYRSPYTGKMIPLNRLFTTDYEIEHVIPKSRYFDDSFSNKVICESAVNKLKDNQLGLEFIKNHHGEIVQTTNGNQVKILDEESYNAFIVDHYEKTRFKKTKLLLDEIPEKMIERQLNDTRYISKFISGLLSNIVRSETNDDGINSKYLISCNGKITSTLKQDWGLNDVWNDIILPRFERMNQLTNSTAFTTYNSRYQKYLPTVPFELSKGFQKKRIDHRHHAMDALVIACATRDHVNLLNNQYAESKEKRYDLQRKLRTYVKTEYTDPKTGNKISRDVPKEFYKPWKNFTIDAKVRLDTLIVSFKQNLRIINKTSNKYASYKDETGKLRVGKDSKPIKAYISQTKGDSWAIRKPMHKETVSGLIDLPRMKVPNGKIITATRKSLDSSFDSKNIESITDTGIQKILINHLKNYDAPKIEMEECSISEEISKRKKLIKDKKLTEYPKLSFSPEGIEDMNKDIKKYNNGNPHQPIYKVRTFELGSKFPLGEKGNKKGKFVEATKGTNLFFAVYQAKNGNRNFETIPLNEVIEHQKWRATLPKSEQFTIPMIPVNPEKGTFLFSLSPNDLVYVPDENELENTEGIDLDNLDREQMKRFFVVNDFSGTCYFTPNHLAKSIAPKEVDLSFDSKKKKTIGSFDTKTASFNGKQIKDICMKLYVNRIGQISPIIKLKS